MKIILLFITFLFFYNLTFSDTIQKKVLSNDLTIVTQKVNNFPIISFDIFVKSGTTIHPNSKIYEYIISNFIFKKLKEDKNIFNFITSIIQDSTRYNITFYKEYFDNVIDIIKESISIKDIQDQIMQEAIKSAEQEIKLKISNPDVYIDNLFYQNAYTVHRYKEGLFYTGDLQNLNIKKEDLIEYIDRYYSPSNIIFVIAGDIEPQEIIEKIENKFQDARYRFIEVEEKLEPPIELKQIVVEKNISDDKAYFGIAWRAPSVKDTPDVYIADVLLMLLSEGVTSRLVKKLQIEKEVCKEIRAEFLTQKEPGLFKIICDTDVKNIDIVKELIMQEMFKLKKELVSPSEIQKAKLLVENLVAIDTETLSGKTSYLGFYEAISSFDFAVSYLDEINKVTPLQIKDFATKVFSDKNYVICILKSK